MAIFLTGVRSSKRILIFVLIPCFSLFSWYYVFSNNVLELIVDEPIETFSLYNASFNFMISLTLILSTSLIRRIEKTSVLYSWSILSIIGTIFIILAPTEISRLAIYLLLGIVFGVGVSAFFAFFWDLTVPEERGRVAGLMGFIFLPLLILVAVPLEKLDLFRTATLCIILNLAPLAIKLLNPEKTTILTKKENPKGYNPEKRTILLYSIPWVIYSLINATLARTVSFYIMQHFSPSSPVLLGVLQIVAGGLGSIIGGVIADFFGRRISLAFGLTLFGFSSAISGLAQRYEVFCLAFIGTGLTWGILLILYSFVIWGDLATKETCAHRYSIGLAIFYSASGLGALFSPEMLQISLLIASVVSCLLIFLSNVPLILAPELLPSDFREEIRLQLYVSLVKRIVKSRKDTTGQSREC